MKSFLLVRFSDPFLRLDQTASGQISSVDGQNSVPNLYRPVSVKKRIVIISQFPSGGWAYKSPFGWTIGLDKGDDKRPPIFAVRIARP